MNVPVFEPCRLQHGEGSLRDRILFLHFLLPAGVENFRQPLPPGAGQVKVVGHQRKADEAHRDPTASQAEQPEEIVVIVGIVEDAGEAITPIEGMVTIAGDSSPSGARHAGDCRGPAGPPQGKTATSRRSRFGRDDCEKCPQCPLSPN